MSMSTAAAEVTTALTEATAAALERAAALGTADAPVRLAFPLLAGGHGGLSVGVSLKAMVDGLKRFFHETPDAPVGTIVFAVPESDKYRLAKSRLEQLLVLR